MTFLLIMPSQSYLREALASFLRSEIEAVEIVTAGHPEKIATLPDQIVEAIGLVLLHVDGERADGTNVIRMVGAVRARLEATPIVLLGDSQDESQYRLALSVGTNGYIPTDTPAAVFKHALPIIANGGVYAPPFVFASCPKDHHDATPISKDDPPPVLNDVGMNDDAVVDIVPDAANSVETFTRRELEVLSLLAEGLPNKLIAYHLDLKEGTVKVHVRHIMNKLNVTSRTKAALFAQKNLSGLIG